MSQHEERTSWLLEECTFDFCEGTLHEVWMIVRNKCPTFGSSWWMKRASLWRSVRLSVGGFLDTSLIFLRYSFYKVLVKRKSELFHSSVARPDSGSAVRRVSRKGYSFIAHTDGNSFPCCGHTPWLHVVSCLAAGLKHLNTMCTIKLASGSFNPNTAFSSWLFKH